jgi:hypothetical protein
MTDTIAPVDQSPSSATAAGPQGTARLTPSMLFHAFPDRVAKPAGRLDRAKDVPCAGPGVKVKQDALAVALVQVALWDLLRRQRVRLEEVEKKVLFIKTRSIKVRVAEGAQLADEVQDSLEADLLRSAIGQRGEGDVRSVIRALYKKDVDDPYRDVLAMSNVAQVAAGLAMIEVEQRHGIAKVLGSQQKLIWQCDRVAAHRADFDRVVADWNHDHDVDTAAFERLSTEIDRAIGSRKASDDDDGPDGDRTPDFND